MKRLIDRLVKWLTAGAEAHPYDRFIAVRSNGTAHFDVAAYLASPEGEARLHALCSATDKPTRTSRAA